MTQTLDMTRTFPLDELCDTFAGYFNRVHPKQIEESISSFLVGIVNDERMDPERTHAFIEGIKKFIGDMREINENFRKNYPALTALELDRPYKAGQSYPGKSPIGTLEITVKQYIRFKDLPKRIQNIIEDGFCAADYHDDYYDMTEEEFAQVPFATAIGSDGDPYILIRMEDDEWEAINTDETKYLNVSPTWK